MDFNYQKNLDLRVINIIRVIDNLLYRHITAFQRLNMYILLPYSVQIIGMSCTDSYPYLYRFLPLMYKFLVKTKFSTIMDFCYASVSPVH